MKVARSNANIAVTIPPGFLDLSQLDDRLEDALFDIAIAGRNFWESEAGRRLNSSREKYVDAITFSQTTGSVSLRLNSRFANMIETGASSFSLRPGYLKSPKIKQGTKKIPKYVADRRFVPTDKNIRWMVIPITDKTGNVTFRTFREDHPPTKWMHPGFKGYRILDAVEEELIDEIIPDVIDKLIDEVFS